MSGCQDVCVAMDYDSSEGDFSRSEVRQARKQHRCVECADTIAIGDRYEYVAGKSDGEMWTAKARAHGCTMTLPQPPETRRT